MKLKEIAEQVGVSSSTISIVRQGKPGVSAALRRKVQLLLDENGYDYLPYGSTTYQAVSVQTPVKSEGKPICLLKFYRSAMLTDHNEGFVEGIIDAIEYAVRNAGHTLVLTSVSPDEYTEFLYSSFQDEYAGMIVIATEMTRDEITSLSRITIPTVILDTDYAFIPHTSVSMNNRKLAWHAVTKLEKNVKIGYLQSNQETGNFSARAIGYHEAVKNFGLSGIDQFIFKITPDLNQAEKDMEAYILNNHPLPRAFFADNDVIAIGCIRALLHHGIHIPEDVEIIAVDNTLLAQVITPSLSSVQISKLQMGDLSVQLLLQKIASPNMQDVHIRIDTQLVCRETTRKQTSDL